MTKKEIVERNIGMTFDFVRYLVGHPDIAENMPNGAVIKFVDKEVAVKEAPVIKARKEKTVSFCVEHLFKPIKPTSHLSHSAL